MPAVAKLSELIEALLFDSPEHVTRYDREEGCLVIVENCVMSAVEEGDEERLRDLPDWQKVEVEIARAIIESDGDRFISPPDKFDFHEYRQMERFIGTIETEEVAEQLWRAIKGKGAFRHFKAAADRLGLLDRWYRHRDAAMKEFVIEWAEANEVPFEDDLKRGGS
jgi:hypothetical protein